MKFKNSCQELATKEAERRRGRMYLMYAYYHVLWL